MKPVKAVSNNSQFETLMSQIAKGICDTDIQKQIDEAAAKQDRRIKIPCIGQYIELMLLQRKEDIQNIHKYVVAITDYIAIELVRAGYDFCFERNLKHHDLDIVISW